VYRASKPLIDPVTKENLGYEVMYGGDAVVDKLGDEIQTMHLTKVNSEILVGDRLIKAPRTSLSAMCRIARMAISRGRSSRSMTVWTARPSTPT
jgi:hypothetical protein